MMWNRLFPKQVDFFVQFKKLCDLLLESSKEFELIIISPQDSEKICFHLADIEARADTVTHETFNMLHESFITPFDRDDIHKLVTTLDDVVDLVEATAHRIYIYKIQVVHQEMKELAKAATDSIEKVCQMISALNNLKNPEELLTMCIEINRIENDSDRLLRKSLKRLFEEEQDTKHLIKLKEIYEFLELITDTTESIANQVQGLILDYA